jgi:hypothetical protein
VSVKPVNANRGRFAEALGEAVVQAWAKLPRDIQETLFETAVVCGHHDERDESLREQLAEFLHDQHPRTGAENPDKQPPIGEVKYAAINSKS